MSGKVCPVEPRLNIFLAKIDHLYHDTITKLEMSYLEKPINVLRVLLYSKWTD